MHLPRVLPASALLLLLFSAFAAQVVAEPASVTVAIDHGDGGKTGKRHLGNLLNALNEEGCSVVLHDAASDTPAQLLFDARPVSVAEKERPDYRLIARAKTLEGQLMVKGAILVHASTGITDLSTLQGERISFVGKESWSGYRLPFQLLQDAGVEESPSTFFYVGNHVGAISMLLHSDVFVAVTAEPLARQWADANGLSIVAVSDEVETSGWWMQRSLSENQTHSCAQALTRLDRSHLKALPAWIDGFAIPESNGMTK